MSKPAAACHLGTAWKRFRAPRADRSSASRRLQVRGEIPIRRPTHVVGIAGGQGRQDRGQVWWQPVQDRQLHWNSGQHSSLTTHPVDDRASSESASRPARDVTCRTATPCSIAAGRHPPTAHRRRIRIPRHGRGRHALPGRDLAARWPLPVTRPSLLMDITGSTNRPLGRNAERVTDAVAGRPLAGRDRRHRSDHAGGPEPGFSRWAISIAPYCSRSRRAPPAMPGPINCASGHESRWPRRRVRCRRCRGSTLDQPGSTRARPRFAGRQSIPTGDRAGWP